MRKIFATMVLAVALIFVAGQTNQAEAYDRYVGTWRSGYDAYLMTETLRVNYSNFDCTVKAVRGSSVMYIDYHFYGMDGDRSAFWYFSNSDGVNNSVDNGTSIEKNILSFVRQNYRIW